MYVDLAEGADTNAGTAAAPLKTLHAAQAAVRKVKESHSGGGGGVDVIIAPGEYELTEPLALGEADSGSSALAPVRWWANGSPGSVLVSAGSRVTGWTKVQSNSSFDVWAADVTHINPNGTQDRHLYVDGKRQNRTRPVEVGQIFGGSSSDNTSFTLSGLGAQIALSWPMNRGAAGRGVEFIWEGGRAGWTEPRCAVDHVEQLNATHTRVVMMQPCFFNLRYRSGGLCFFGLNSAPKQVINVGADAIRQPHDWALVNSADTGKIAVHLAFATGSDPTHATVRLPRLEALVSGYATRHIHFTGIEFGYATWLRPGQGDGFVDFQGGACLVGRKEGNQNCSEDNTQIVTPGNLPFR